MMWCPYIGKPLGRGVFLQGIAKLKSRASVQAMLFGLVTLLSVFAHGSAMALEPITITGAKDVIDISARGVFYEGRGDRLQVETAAGRDGIAGRMSVRARQSGSNPRWVVFALHNGTNQTIEQWLTAQRYSLNDSKFFNPDLDKARIGAVTPSVGFAPERVSSDNTDIFSLSVEAGADRKSVV